MLLHISATQALAQGCLVGRKVSIRSPLADLYWLTCETGVAQIFTVDVRDFSRYRLPDGRSFEIL